MSEYLDATLGISVSQQVEEDSVDFLIDLIRELESGKPAGVDDDSRGDFELRGMYL